VLSLVSAQWDFVEAQLVAARAAQQKPVFVMHHPPFITTEDEPDQYFNWPAVPRARLLALAREHGVRLFLCGHTHTTTDVSTADGVRVLTTAGTSRAFDTHGCGYQTLRIDAGGINVTYSELPGGGGAPGCEPAPSGALL
jgi:3',5'-cyclic AMP phosphodiesterase CpdA